MIAYALFLKERECDCICPVVEGESDCVRPVVERERL